jgi:hypothetical protein
MSIIKQAKDNLIKFCICSLNGRNYVPRELLDMFRYFKNYGPIKFKFNQEENRIVAVSTNFIHGSIVTSGKNVKELDENIKDAILTSFEIPSSYAKEADIRKASELKLEYAAA